MPLFDLVKAAVEAAQPDEYIVALEWQGTRLKFATVPDPRRIPKPRMVIVQKPRIMDAKEAFIINPDPQVGRFAITPEQLKALRGKFEQDADGAESFETFKSRARPAGFGSDRYILLQWCGMSLGIELDGYTHS